MNEFLKEQLERTNYWLAFSEAKNGGLVAVNIAIIAVVTQLTVMPFFMEVIVCCLFLVSSIINILSFYSNLRNKIKKKQKDDIDQFNLLVYRDIAKFKDADTYLTALKDNYGLEIKNNKKVLYYDFITEIIINSEIAVYKYKMFNKAVFVDVFGILILIIALVAA